MTLSSERSELSRILSIPITHRQKPHVDVIFKLTQDIEFFKMITAERNSSEIHRECCSLMSLEHHGAEDIIIHFGEIGKKFYIILSGSVSVRVPVKKTVKLDVKKQSEYEKLANQSFSELSESSEPPEVIEKPAKNSRRAGIGIINAHELMDKFKNINNTSFNNEGSLFEENEEKTIARLFQDKLKTERKLIMDLLKNTENGSAEVEIEKFDEVTVLRKGQFFGELALISDRPRVATIVAREPTSLLVLKKSEFKQILGSIAEKKMAKKVNFLKCLPYFLTWSKASLSKLAYYFQPFSVKHKQILFSEGDKTNGIYFIKEGEFTLSKRLELNNAPKSYSFASEHASSNYVYKKPSRIVRTLKVVIKGKNESIGGYEVLNSVHLREYTCTCTSLGAEGCFVQQDHFLTKIPNFEAIKVLLEEENERLVTRYSDLREVEEIIMTKAASESSNKHNLRFLGKFQTGEIDKPTSVTACERRQISPICLHIPRVATSSKQMPAMRDSTRDKYQQERTQTSSSPISSLRAHRSNPPCFKLDKISLNKLARIKIHEAINGRIPRHSSKTRRFYSFVNKQSPPNSLSSNLKTLSKVKKT